jgi:hypothetical protein
MAAPNYCSASRAGAKKAISAMLRKNAIGKDKKRA